MSILAEAIGLGCEIVGQTLPVLRPHVDRIARKVQLVAAILRSTVYIATALLAGAFFGAYGAGAVLTAAGLYEGVSWYIDRRKAAKTEAPPPPPLPNTFQSDWTSFSMSNPDAETQKKWLQNYYSKTSCYKHFVLNCYVEKFGQTKRDTWLLSVTKNAIQQSNQSEAHACLKASCFNLVDLKGFLQDVVNRCSRPDALLIVFILTNAKQQKRTANQLGIPSLIHTLSSKNGSPAKTHLMGTLQSYESGQ